MENRLYICAVHRGFAKKIIIFLLLINPALLLAELNPAAARLEPLPIARRLALAADPLAPEDFVDAALYFSGLTDSAVASYRGKIDAVIADVKNAFARRKTDRALAEDLLQYLHAHYLKRYVADETGLPRLLDDGLFNCVSSSVFYLVAADALGLSAAGVRTKDHAFVRVFFGNAAYDAETTSRFGFDPGKRKEFINEFGKTTGFVYTPPSNYADRRDIGRKEMLSLILVNRVAACAAAQRFDEAVGVGADLFELMKNEESLKILTGIFSGLAGYALETAEYQAGYEILNGAVSAYRDFNQFQELRRSFVRDWADALVGRRSFAEAEALVRREYAQGKITSDDYRAIMLFRYQSEADVLSRDPGRGPAAALDLLAEAKKELGDAPALLEAEKAYSHNLLLDLIEKGRFDEAQATLEKLRAEKKIDEADYLAIAVFYAQRRAELAGKEGRFWDALILIEEGLAKTNRAPALLKSAGVYSYNWAVKLIQTGSFTEAAEFLAGEKASAYLSAETRQDLALYLCTGRAEAARKNNDYPAAIAIIEAGVRTLGRKPELLRSYEVLVHNLMIRFYEAKDYDKAEETLRQGLAFYPTSALLKEDLEKIKKLKNQ
jgi:tetratricopeptide (TPR) repeat protein